ncbi:MAG: hypothetical protein RLZZ271_6 [Pseudomonadota bacterium]|jgi:hypothetical protein
MLMLVSLTKMIAEIALLALAGRWLLGMLTGSRREQNLFYQVLDIMARPFVRGARLISPKQIIDRHVPLVAFSLLLFVWLVVTIAKINVCLQIGVELCK